MMDDGRCPIRPCSIHLPSCTFLPTMLRLCAAMLTMAVVSLVVIAGAEAALATHSTSTIGLLALDPNVQGNTATSLGPIDGCARVEAGARIDVDYVVDSVPEDRPIIAFEVEVRYDPQLVEPVALDHKLLLAAAGSYSPFAALTDDLPDSDGNLRISVLDTASKADPEANVERGAGVLARITFLAKAAGISEIAVVVEPEPAPVYPLVQDSQNETIFADRLGSASLAVGQECPAPAAEPKITDLAQVNQELQTANLQLGASPTAEGASATPTPGATTAEDETPPAATTDPACIVSALQMPTPSAIPSEPHSIPVPEGQTTPSEAAIATETPSPTSAPSEAPCTPKPTPRQDEIVDVTGDSDTLLMAGALALFVLGIAAGGGGLYLLRRSPAPAPTDEPPGDTTPD